MIIVTGGAGFIGSNIVKALNERGEQDIVVVDNLTDGRQFKNIVDCSIIDYWDCQYFLERVKARDKCLKNIRAIFHEGACPSPQEWNGRFMMENNYAYSKQLLHFCLEKAIPFLYASSAATYGGSNKFIEAKPYESPITVYGYSKLLFDQYVRRQLSRARSQVVGFRYFNVYGPRESHKGAGASMAFHFNRQVKETGVAKLFEGIDGIPNGQQQRDFIYVGDVVNVNLWFYTEGKKRSGVFNVGTGRAQTFNDLANAVIKWHGSGKIEYIPFPESLRGHYQNYTQADLTKLREAGYRASFKSVEEGVPLYMDWLNK